MREHGLVARTRRKIVRTTIADPSRRTGAQSFRQRLLNDWAEPKMGHRLNLRKDSGGLCLPLAHSRPFLWARGGTGNGR